MMESDDQTKPKTSWGGTGRYAVSFVSVILTQFALSMVPGLFPISSVFILLLISATVMLAVAGVGRCCKGFLGVRASAPAFVFFNILFIWGVYVAVIRRAISLSMDIVFNGEVVMLMIGLCRILSSDPGFVPYLDNLIDLPVTDVETHPEEYKPSTHDIHHEFPAEEQSALRRIRYCRHCKAYVRGFDHHCPAFGNCIGQKNHTLFILLLVGFVVAEASYVSCSFQFATNSQILDGSGWKLPRNLAISTMLFSLLQVLWQGVFLAWHIYCVCFNIRTDEWINWKRYREFQLVDQPQPGENIDEKRFRNPYDKGILLNVKEFLVA